MMFLISLSEPSKGKNEEYFFLNPPETDPEGNKISL